MRFVSFPTVPFVTLFIVGSLLDCVTLSLARGEGSHQLPQQPNDIPGTIHGCANAILASDKDDNGIVTRDEYLMLANTVAGLLCWPPLPNETFQLQTVFISTTCLCEELEEFEPGCCYGEDAGILVQGAAVDADSRTQDETFYLRSVCLLLQAMFGASQCDEEIGSIYDFTSEDDVTAQGNNDKESTTTTTTTTTTSVSSSLDVAGTVSGCIHALLASDDNRDGVIRRDEYLDFVNSVGALLCMPSKSTLDLQLQTSFISFACLCLERPDSESSCCFEDYAAIDLAGAADATVRTIDQENYLRAVCVLTQAAFGHGQCDGGSSPAPSSELVVADSTTTTSDMPGKATTTTTAPRVNEIAGTFPGCAEALLAHDYDHNNRMDVGEEYLGFVNSIAELLCVPSRSELDLELQTAYISIACLCVEWENNDESCCIGFNATIHLDGLVADSDSRTAEQESLLRAACLITETVVGPNECTSNATNELLILNASVSTVDLEISKTLPSSRPSQFSKQLP